MRKHLRLSLGLAALVAAGCGGDGPYHFIPPSTSGSTTLPAPVGGSLPAGSSSVTAPAGAPVTTSVSVTDPTTGAVSTVAASVPGGVTILPTDKVSLISPTFPVGINALLATNIPGKVNPRTGLIPGEVYIVKNGTHTDTGYNIQGITIQGTKGAGKIAFPANGNSLRLEVAGPFFIGTSAKHLTVKQGFEVDFGRFGTKSWPTGATYTLPANGGNLSSSNITVLLDPNFDYANNTNGSAELTYAGQDKTYSAAIDPVNYDLHIIDPQQDTTTDVIPADGIDYMTLSIGLIGG